MRKIIPLIFTMSLVSALHAGFFGGVLEGLTANALSGSSSSAPAYINERKERLDQVNEFLWHQHKNNSYDKSTKFYIKWVEKQLEISGFDDILIWDTLAWVYKDSGDKKKAIKIYKTRILPWVKIYFKNDKGVKNSKTAHQEFREKWENNFKKIQK